MDGRMDVLGSLPSSEVHLWLLHGSGNCLPAKLAAVTAHRDGEGVPPSPALGGLPLGTFLVHRGNLCWPHPEHQGEGAQAMWPGGCG